MIKNSTAGAPVETEPLKRQMTVRFISCAHSLSPPIPFATSRYRRRPFDDLDMSVYLQTTKQIRHLLTHTGGLVYGDGRSLCTNYHR